ncbi:2Fe-2S iron-sulfur cluster-binding protein [Streptomyces sp. NPDC091215]|uniref:2Fe-2S iron-sulfur cluster-binding protein n=1 Tax=Streptomyces sp. NPDC091215 TaxID=3155192 RepID=UPI0034184D2C
MTDDQHAEGAPSGGGGRWDPLPQGDYDDGATAFVKLPEGGIEALLAGNSPLAAPGHGYVPPQITVAPGTETWGAPADGAQWPDPNAVPQGQPADDRFTYNPATTQQWTYEEPPPAPGHEVTGQWSIPVARGDVPDESGEFTTSALMEQWGGTPPSTLPGGAAAPWATEAPAWEHPAEAPGAPAGASPGRGVTPPATPASGPAGAPPGPEGRAAGEPGDPAGTGELRRAGDPSGAGRPSMDTGHIDTHEPSPDGAPTGAREAAVSGRPGGVREPGVFGDRAGDGGAADGHGAPHPHPVPASGPQAADGESAPQGPPAPDDGSGTDGAGGEQHAEGEAEAIDDHPLASYVLRVNSTDRPVTDAWIGESLLYVLRERLGLAGAKDGCSQGECGACNVQVDGRLVASCLVPAVTAAGSEVRTVEGLAQDGHPSDVQRALARCGAVQCGFCVPGMAMTVHDLLEGNPAPTELEARQALCGNLCRCSGYRGVLDAVQEVVAEREAHAAADAETDGDEARIPHQAGPGAGGVKVSAFDSPGTFGAGIRIPHEQTYDQSFGGNQSFGGDQSFGGNQPFGGDQSFGGNQSFGGDQSFGGNQSFGGDQSFGGNQSFGGDQTFGDQSQSYDDQSYGPDGGQA